MSKYLIVAYQTAGGQALRDAVQGLIQDDPEAEFSLLVPATHTQHLFTWTEGESTAVARERADLAALQLRAAGLRLSGVRVGPADPFVAVSTELADHPDYHAIIVSTFPPGISRWLRLDLPSRLEKEFEIPIIHVVVEPESIR